MVGSVSDDRAEITLVDHFATAISGFAMYGRFWECWRLRTRELYLQRLSDHSARRRARAEVLYGEREDELVLVSDWMKVRLSCSINPGSSVWCRLWSRSVPLPRLLFSAGL